MRPSVVVVLGPLWLGACDACEATSPPTPMRPSLPEVAEPGDAELLDAWSRASSALGVAPGTAVMSTIRYQLPSCRLGYELRVRQQHEVAPGRPATGTEVIATLALEPQGDHARFVLEASRTDVLAEGERKPGTPQKPATVPPKLHVLDRGWQEIDGPTLLWMTHGELPPLATFFPELPSTTAADRDYVWRRATMRPEIVAKLRARPRDAGHPTPPELVDEITLAVHGSVSLSKPGVESVSALVLEARWSILEDGFAPLHGQRVERWRGRFVVSEHGRLVHAALVANRHHWWSNQPGESASKRSRAEHELLLVQACDGPTLVAHSPRESD